MVYSTGVGSAAQASTGRLSSIEPSNGYSGISKDGSDKSSISESDEADRLENEGRDESASEDSPLMDIDESASEELAGMDIEESDSVRRSAKESMANGLIVCCRSERCMLSTGGANMEPSSISVWNECGGGCSCLHCSHCQSKSYLLRTASLYSPLETPAKRRNNDLYAKIQFLMTFFFFASQTINYLFHMPHSHHTVGLLAMVSLPSCT